MPEAVALISHSLARNQSKANASEPATEMAQSEPQIAQPPARTRSKKPIWIVAIRIAGVVAVLRLIYGVVQVITGQMNWDQFMADFDVSLLIGFVIMALLLAVWIRIWRALSAPLPAEIQTTSDRSNDVEHVVQQEFTEPVGNAADIVASNAPTVEPSTESTPAEPHDPMVYQFPEGLVTAPKRPIWKRVADARAYNR